MNSQPSKPCSTNEHADETLGNQQRIELDQDEAARFLDALGPVDQETIALLHELRKRPWL